MGDVSKPIRGAAVTEDKQRRRGSVLESLQDDFEAFGLGGYEARVLLALLQLGSATASQVSELSGVGRTSVYPVLRSLTLKGLAEQLPGKSGIWASSGRAQVMDRLYESQERRLQELHERRRHAEARLEELGREGSPPPLPYVHIVRGIDETNKAFNRILSEATSEVVMFVRPPYTYVPGTPNPVVLDMMARGVGSRVLYQQGDLADPAAEGARREIDAYHAAGVQGRVVDELAVKLVVADRSVVLVAMMDPVLPEVGFPTNLLIEHPGYADLQADAFDKRWEAGKPYYEVLTRATTPGVAEPGEEAGIGA